MQDLPGSKSKKASAMIQVETVGWRWRSWDWNGSHRAFCYFCGWDGCGGWAGSHQACVFCGWDVGTGDINEFCKKTHGIERCLGTQKLQISPPYQ